MTSMTRTKQVFKFPARSTFTHEIFKQEKKCPQKNVSVPNSDKKCDIMAPCLFITVGIP